MAYLRFNRRIRLGKYLRLNLGKRSVSVTAGARRGGPHFTASTNGTNTTSVGLPGTGLSIVSRRKRRPIRAFLRKAIEWL